jgi:nitric oxide dioxygenase
MESELVTSFVFAPVDNKPVINFKPGQYLGVEIKDTKREFTEIRQYSLSDKANNQQYRISVKREVNPVPGIVSNYLHDQLSIGDKIKLYAPAGDFFFVNKAAPVVLLSAGVGITPMQAILETLAQQNYNHQVYYLHACENSEQHSFNHRTTQLINQHSWQQHIWYRNETDESDYIHQGMMDLTQVALPIERGDFYLCGPVAFMQFAKKQLLHLGVSSERIHYEVFGPHADL